MPAAGASWAGEREARARIDESIDRTNVIVVRIAVAALVVLGWGACSRSPSAVTVTSAAPEAANALGNPRAQCQLVEDGHGPAGKTRLRAEVVVSGLEVPWSIAFLPGTLDFFVSERPGRIRLVQRGALVPEPVAVVPVTKGEEEGLLGIALHPAFARTHLLYAYFTTNRGSAKVNRIVRYVFDGAHARQDRIVYDDIPAAPYHDGGRIRFGPDGMLYVGTGDASAPERSQDPNGAAGKILRLTPEGGIPKDNPRKGRAAYLSGVRNVQAFDWLEDGRIVVADHGPSGELGRRGHDEVSVASAGQNLGWPGTWSCERRLEVVTPLLVFEEAVPPGGAVYYQGDAIPEWRGSFIIGTLRSEHLHRVVFDRDRQRVLGHEVYLQGPRPSGFGRLRDVVTGPDGAIYVTTSNCDGRGACPDSKDAVVRITAER